MQVQRQLLADASHGVAASLTSLVLHYRSGVLGSPSIAWGDVPTWMTFLATAGATAGAVIAARVAWRAWRYDVEHARRGQAEKVSAWLDDSALGVGRNLGGCVLLNVSGQPAYRVVAYADVQGEQITLHERHVLPPGPESRVTIAAEAWQRLEPLLRATPDSGSRAQDWAKRFNDIPVALEFSDAAGRRWRRDFHGQLIRMER